MIENKKWYQKTWFSVLMLIFIWPVGLFTMWKFTDWKKYAKIIITVIIGICLVFSITSFGNSDIDEDYDIESTISVEEIDDSDSNDIDTKQLEEEATMEAKASGTYYFDYVMTEGYTFNADELYNYTGEDYSTDYIKLKSNSKIDTKIAGIYTDGLIYSFDDDYDSLSIVGMDGYDFSIDVEEGTITIEDPTGVVMVYQK